MNVTARLGQPLISDEVHAEAFAVSKPARLPAQKRPVVTRPPLTRHARWVFFTLGVLFAVSVLCKLNGSSTAIFRSSRLNDIRAADSPSGLLLSTPKAIRADEWQVWTPAILSQAHQQPVSFPVANPSLGPGKTPLLMSLPARHYTMLLRPQLWGYFFLPLDYAFSWNWQCKVFGLFAGMFLLFWTLTSGRLGPSLFGAAMVEFSPFVQWWFSSPSMLPEMLACWSLAIVAAISLLGAQDLRGRLLSTLALVASGTNFFLCCYVGFEMPLLYLGVCLLLGYIFQKRPAWRTGIPWLAAAAGLIVLWLIPWLIECLPEMRTVSHTVYPGQRVCTGGHLSFLWYFSAFYDFALGETNCPRTLGNVCEAANFYPLWLLPLGLGFWSLYKFLRRRPALLTPWLAVRGMKVAACAYLAGMTLFCFVPFPRWFCDITLLTHSQEARCTVGVGMAGMFLLVLSMGGRSHRRAFTTRAILAGCAWTLGVLAILLVNRTQLGSLQTPVRFLGTWMAAVLLGAGYLFVPPNWFQTSAASAFFLAFATVNPLCTGLPELLESPMLHRLQTIVSRDPQAELVAYDSLFGIEMIKATGAHVINGIHTIPDFSILHALDPSGRDAQAYNRYAHLILLPENPASTPTVELYNMVFCKVRITPAQLTARFPNLRFIAAPHALPQLEAEGFQLIENVPADRFWLYHKGPLAMAEAVPAS